MKTIISIHKNRIAATLLLTILLLTACQPQAPTTTPESQVSLPQITNTPPTPFPTDYPERPAYAPGELVEYIVQTGDTLPALAAHFNTTQEEIHQENTMLPNRLTTLPPGMPMQIPIYYQPLWGTPFQIIPDSHYINGPALNDFDTVEFVNSQPGWLKRTIDYPGGNKAQGGEIIDHVATNFSISPRLLLAIIEYQTGALSQSSPTSEIEEYPLGFKDNLHQGLSQQLVLAANILNNGYYGWRNGSLISFEHQDGRLEYPDPWQNASTVALQYYFSHILSADQYKHATTSLGLAQTYTDLFGDPWQQNQDHIAGSLSQPEFVLPFAPDKRWTYTGGPHTGWGTGYPWAALDFAPPGIRGCSKSNDYVAAVADGIIVRTDVATAVLDLDGDGNERTGWVIFYLHLETDSIPPEGTQLQKGDPIGYPSCEGGSSTGTHIHIARKYNGEWIPASGPLAFNMDGWVAACGKKAYDGQLIRFGSTLIASTVSDGRSQFPIRQ